MHAGLGHFVRKPNGHPVRTIGGMTPVLLALVAIIVPLARVLVAQRALPAPADEHCQPAHGVLEVDVVGELH